jgi:hypothetical protein
MNQIAWIPKPANHNNSRAWARLWEGYGVKAQSSHYSPRHLAGRGLTTSQVQSLSPRPRVALIGGLPSASGYFERSVVIVELDLQEGA